MDGERIRSFWAAEATALLAAYEHFEKLLPHGVRRGASHVAEDGRYVEALLRTYLKKFLPSSVEVFSGFVLRPAVKTAKSSRKRQHDQDAHSRQLDIIVYDSAMYPVYQRFEDSAIVPPEGVLAIISVKKTLQSGDIAKESQALADASRLCQCETAGGSPLRGPFLALVGMRSVIKGPRMTMQRWVFERLRDTYASAASCGFEETIGYIGALDSWSIVRSRRPSEDPKLAQYIYLCHREGEAHLALQHLLTGILGVFYDPSRRLVCRPGFTSFPSRRMPDGILGRIPVVGLRRPKANSA